MVADAAKYLPPGRPAVRRALAPVARLGMAVMTPEPDSSRAPLQQARSKAARLARGLTAALDAGLSGGAAEAPFLNRLLLHTDEGTCAGSRRSGAGSSRTWSTPATWPWCP